MDPTFLFFLFLVVIVALATTNDVLKWSDAEDLLRKMKKQRQRLAMKRAQKRAEATREPNSLEPKGESSAARHEQVIQDRTP